MHCSDYSGGAEEVQAPGKDGQVYFDAEGKLLHKYYPFVYEQLFEEAKRQGKDISFLEASAPFEVRRAAIKASGWEVGAAIIRCSTDIQDSYLGQLDACSAKGIRENIIVLPELVAGDEGITGKRSNRPGLNTLKVWITAKLMSVIVFFSISRCSRTLYKGLQFIQEEVVEHDVRAIAIVEVIDTSTPAWRDILTLNLFVAEKQAKAIPYFVRMGQKSQFEAGFAVGAVPVGYRLVEVPEAGLNKKGNPKTKPEIVPEVKDLIIKHFKMIAAGTPLAEGCRLWNAEISGWPDEMRRYAVDGRAKSKTMRPEAYRRMLSRGLYRGEYVFGKKRNHWLEGKEQTIQKNAPEQEVSRQHREHLRIVPDELFLQVQERLADEPRGKHGPRLDKEPRLSSALISLFHCAECGRSFYSYGTRYAHCPGTGRGECSSWATIDREIATSMILSALRDQIRACSGLVVEVVEKSRKLDMVVDSDNYAERHVALQQSIHRQKRLLMNIAECFAEAGMDAEAKQRQREVTREILRLEAELATLTSQNENPRRPVTEKQVTSLLKDFDAILADAGSGQLGGEAKQRAVSLIRLLTGSRIAVSFIRLKGRRRAFGVGHFTPSPMTALVKEGGLNTEVDITLPEVRLEFRELPRYARIADEVYQLYADGEGLSMTEIAKQFGCESGNIWEAYAYWHTSRGLEVPIKRPGMRERKNK